MRIDTGRPPTQKPEKRVKDSEHLARVARLPCAICYHFDMVQRSQTQVHHVIHGRFGTRKAGDHQTIPLCEGHHLGDFDKSKLAIHRGKETWANNYGPDYVYLSWVERCLFGNVERWDDMTERHKRERRELVERMAASGLTQTKAAMFLGITLQCLNNYVQRNNVCWTSIEQGKKQ